MLSWSSREACIKGHTYTYVGLVSASSSQCILYLFPFPHLPGRALPFLCVSEFKYGCSTMPSWATLSKQPCYPDSPLGSRPSWHLSLFFNFFTFSLSSLPSFNFYAYELFSAFLPPPLHCLHVNNHTHAHAHTGWGPLVKTSNRLLSQTEPP